MSRLPHPIRTLLLFGCTSFAVLLGACGGGGGGPGGTGAGARYISVSWGVFDTATGQQVPCSLIDGFGPAIVQVDGSTVSFDNQSCAGGVTYSTTQNLQRGVYNGSLELLSPNGTVVAADAVAAFDVTPVGEAAFSDTFHVNDVCAHNRYFLADWSVDHGVGTATLSCNQSSTFTVRLDVAQLAQSFELAAGCDDHFASNWTGISADSVPPGTYSVSSALLSSTGASLSTTPSQLVTVGSCSPGSLTDLAFGIR